VNNGPETPENGWLARFCPPTPQIFALGDIASITAWTLYNRQQANFGTCYTCCRLTLGFAMHFVGLAAKLLLIPT